MILLIILFFGVFAGLFYFIISSNSNKEQKAPNITTTSLELTSKDSIEIAKPVADSAAKPFIAPESPAELAGKSAIAIAVATNAIIDNIIGNTSYSVINIAIDQYKINLNNAINKAKDAAIIALNAGNAALEVNAMASATSAAL